MGDCKKMIPDLAENTLWVEWVTDISKDVIPYSRLINSPKTGVFLTFSDTAWAYELYNMHTQTLQ